MYDGGTQNTTINLKNGNGTLIGTGFGFGTINGNDILVNSNDVVGNLNVVEYIDLRNFTTADIQAATTTPATQAAILEAFKHWLRKNKVCANGEAPVYDYSVGGKAATLLLKDGVYTLTDRFEADLDDRFYGFESHTIDANVYPATQTKDIKLIFEITWANQAPTAVADVTYELKQSLFNDTLILSSDNVTQGTLTPTELSRLTTNKYCLIELNNEIYYLNDNQHWTGTLVYTHNGYTTGTTDQKGSTKYIIITINTRGWVKVYDDYLSDVIAGEYSAADGWISFYEEPTVRQNGGTPYSIVLQSSQVPGATMTMPIHLFVSGGVIFGGTVTVKMGTNILNITPYMKKVADNWHLYFHAFIMNGEQAGTNIAAELMPTLTLIGLIRVS